MNTTTIVGLVILIITLTIHFIFLNLNRTYRKEHTNQKSPILKYVLITGLINFIGLGIMIYGMLH